MFPQLTRNVRDLAAGLIFIGLGAGFAAIAYVGLPIGSATRMGPGYFPIVLGIVLAALGLVIGIRGIMSGAASEFGVIPWRGVALTAAALLFFATTLNGLGIAVTVFASAVIGSLASVRVTVAQALTTGIVLSIVCTLIFGEWLNLAVPMVGPWVRFW